MAYAIHKTEAGESLQSVAQAYFAVTTGSGNQDSVRLATAIAGIREGTPVSVTDLTSVSDSAVLTTGSTLFVPTLRSLHRVVYADNSTVQAAIEGIGLHHADKLTSFTAEQVHAEVSASATLSEVQRAIGLTSLLNLDGMDLYTAKYLYDVEGVTSLEVLAGLSYATVAGYISTLQGSPHNRPSQLSQQEHDRGWVDEALLTIPSRPAERLLVRVQTVPVSPDSVRERAVFYEELAEDTSGADETDAKVATVLGYLHRFEEGVLRGHEQGLAGNEAASIFAYQSARKSLHRLAEYLEVVTEVNDRDGMNFKQCADTTKAILEVLPAGEPEPLGASKFGQRRSRASKRSFGLKSFTYDQLETSGTDRKDQLRAALASKPIHGLPRKMRRAAQRAVLAKTQIELSDASTDLTQGLTASGSYALARDFEEVDRTRFLRNLGATTASVLFGQAGTDLDVIDGIATEVPLSDIKSVQGTLWDGLRADQVLSSAAISEYPTTFINRTDVTPYTPYLQLPGLADSTEDVFIPLTSGLAAELRDNFVKPKLTSNRGDDLAVPDEVWEDPGALAGYIPFIYCFQIPKGLGRAYARTGQYKLFLQFGGSRLDTWSGDGLTHVRDVSELDPSSIGHRVDLQQCADIWEVLCTSTSCPYYPAWELSELVESVMEVADAYYKANRVDEAKGLYQDIMCSLENSDADLSKFSFIVFQAGSDARKAQSSFAPIGTRTATDSPFSIRVEYDEGGTTKRIGESWTRVYKTGSGQSKATRSASTDGWFDWLAPTGISNIKVGSPMTRFPSSKAPLYRSSRGRLGLGFSTLEEKAEAFSLFLAYQRCAASVAAIEAGVNGLGYPNDYVPPWTFEHLYREARNLCDRALAAEGRVQSLLQLYESALLNEFQAAQAVETERSSALVAHWSFVASYEAGAASLAQAQHALKQAELQAESTDVFPEVLKEQEVWLEEKAGVNLWTGQNIEWWDPLGDDLGTLSAVASFGFSALSAIPYAGPVYSAAGGTWQRYAQHQLDEQAVESAQSVVAAAGASWHASNNLAMAQEAYAHLRLQQASDYLNFLNEQTLNSEGYAILLGVARQTFAQFLEAAQKLSWLAQRALENQTLRPYNYLNGGFAALSGELQDLNRAQELTQQLELMRADYKANQGFRFQEVKWTVRLSEIAPNGWGLLRQKGECTFVLKQADIDRAFPGTFLHQLKDIRAEFIGLVPPRGVRGVLACNGVYQVRVPADELYWSESLDDDWVTTALAGSTRSMGDYAGYVMRPTAGPLAVLQLSEFDVRSDRVVLSSPEGMLKPVEHIGLNAAWTLSLPMMSNEFDFSNIMDVELTFWFRCGHDRELMIAMQQAWEEMGDAGDMVETHRCSYRTGVPGRWDRFMSANPDTEALDLRRMSWDFDSLKPWQDTSSVSLLEMLVGAARIPERAEDGTHDLTLRVLSDLDPIGHEVTITGDGAVRTASTIATETGDSSLEAWLAALQTAGGNPMGRWVVKVQPSKIGSAWLALEDDGSSSQTTSGALQADSTSAVATATYDDGSVWTDVAFRVMVATGGTTFRLRVRDDGTDHYAVEFKENAGNQELRLFRVDAGVDTQVGTTKTLSGVYPNAEFLECLFAVRGDLLSLSVDGITLFDEVDGNPSAGTLAAGTVGLASLSGGVTSFDDVRVLKMSSEGSLLGTLLEEGFTSSLPADWTTTGSWTISSSGHKVLDLTGLVNLSVNLEYSYGVDFSGGAA